MMFNFPARGHEAKKYDYINVEINVKNCNKGKLKRRTSFEPYIRIKLLSKFAEMIKSTSLPKIMKP